jgi:hypothetical protein
MVHAPCPEIFLCVTKVSGFKSPLVISIMRGKLADFKGANSDCCASVVLPLLHMVLSGYAKCGVRLYLNRTELFHWVSQKKHR